MVAPLLLAGCGKDTQSDSSSGASDSDSDSDSTTGDEQDSAGELGPWEFDDLLGLVNQDDDDLSGKRDWLDLPFEHDDDIKTWTMPAESFVGFAEGDTVELLLAGVPAEQVRAWHAGGIALGHDIDSVHTSYSFTPSDEDEAFSFEFEGFNLSYILTVNHLDADGEVVRSAEVTIRSAPLIMNHHLQPSEHVWAVQVGSNPAFIDAYADNLGDRFTAVAGSTVGGDVWIQDEVEFATSTAPGSRRTDIIIDSIRDRGLDNFPDQIIQPDRFKQTWGQQGAQTTYDSFGNLEATPPITVDGVEYPFGRIYFGKTDFEGINNQLAAFLDGQSLQDPVWMDTSWLCVGHVDEFSSFVPDPSSPKGFKALLADVDAGYELLESMDPNTPLPRYDSGHGYPTVGSIVEDANLRAINEEVRDGDMAIIWDQFRDEFGLDDSDIIGIPTLFEPVQGCGGRVVALMPGMVNLIVTNFEGEGTKLFIPDPFLREDINDQSSDPLLNLFADLMPDSAESIFVDNWQTYHLALGEVHCGTNVTRTPIANWWEVADHLL